MIKLILSIAGAVVADDTCTALALSGGGAHGAYETGVLWGMYNSVEDKSSMAYDVISGVSVGSINAVAASLFPKGQES